MFAVQEFAAVGYGLATLAYAAVVAVVYIFFRQSAGRSFLPLAAASTAIWAGILCYNSVRPVLSPVQLFVTEIGHDAVWLTLLAVLLHGAIPPRSHSLLRWMGVATATAVLGLGAVVGLLRPGNEFSSGFGSLNVLGSIATSLAGLVSIEQIYRNARPADRRALKFLCLALGSIFTYDLFMYSNAVASGTASDLLWVARGYVVALSAPLIGLSLNRIPSFRRGIYASRQVVFYTATLTSAGIYLIAIGTVGYLIRSRGATLGAAMQAVFVAAALLGFVTVLMSDRLRALARVQLAKHFFEHKFDYRNEWLRLSRTLGDRDEGLPLNKRAIKSLAQIVGAPSGDLWQVDARRNVVSRAASWDKPHAAAELDISSRFVTFLREKGWVIDLDELKTTPGRYPQLAGEHVPAAIAGMFYVVPLMLEETLVGFVALSEPASHDRLGFEDHDILKTAGRQIAGLLAQQSATEELAEHRQFEAFNKMTAYIMHDLKNAIAQQSLVVTNAQKHKRNPDFIDDAIETIKGSVGRMTRVMKQLQQGATGERLEKVDLTKLVLKTESHCSDRVPVPVATVRPHPVYVLAAPDRLYMAMCHVVRNAQDATPAGGRISIRLDVQGSFCVVRIEDSGCGMAADFVRDRLFRPFDSTKGASGMGIGAYQVRETMRLFGGDVEVQSELNKGTSFTLRLPLDRPEDYLEAL